jgi:hypothetical protein
MDQDVIEAQGAAVALIGTLLARAGVVEREQFSRLLALMATVTSETHPEQGEILNTWAALCERATGDAPFTNGLVASRRH